MPALESAPCVYVEDLERPKFAAPRRIAGRAHGPALWQTRIRGIERPTHCLALTNGAAPARGEACHGLRSARSALFSASCRTHRLTVAVAVAAGTRVFASTRASRVRPIRLRHGAGLLTLPSGTGLRELVFLRKGRRTRLRVIAPPDARQCGWTAKPAVGQG